MANSSTVNVRVGKVLVNGFWNIKPEYDLNSLHIQVAGQKEKVIFYTDVDSAVYEISPAKTEQFYVLLNRKHYVLTEVKGFKRPVVQNTQSKKKLLDIEKPRSKVFGTLWEKHHVGDVVNDINNYADKASDSVNWVRGKLFGN